jgi:hypothetical protein
VGAAFTSGLGMFEREEGARPHERCLPCGPEGRFFGSVRKASGRASESPSGGELAKRAAGVESLEDSVGERECEGGSARGFKRQRADGGRGKTARRVPRGKSARREQVTQSSCYFDR